MAKYLTGLWHKLTTPRALDGDAARHAYMTRVILTIICATSLVFAPLAAGGWWLGALTFDMPIVALLVALGCAGGLWLANRGLWRVSSYIPPSAIFALALADTYKYGLNVSTFMEYTLAMLLTVLLLNTTAQWIILCLTVIASQSFVWNYRYPQDVVVTMADVVYQLITAGIYFTTLTLLLRFFIQQFRHTLDQAHLYATELTQELQERKRAEDALQISLEKYRQERDFSRALVDAAAVVSRTLAPHKVLDLLLEQVSRVVPNDAANIMLIEDEQQVRIARWRGYERFGAETFVINFSFNLDAMPNLRHMAETHAAMIIPDVMAYPGWVRVPEQAWARAYAGAPIQIHDEILGFLNVDSKTPNFFSPLHAEILSAFADHAAIALQNAQLYHAVEQELEAREQAEAALRESETYFRALFEQASDAIFIEDLDDTIQDVNRQACDLMGYTRQELLRMRVTDLQAPEERGESGHVIKTELAQHHGTPFEGLNLRKDGTRIPVEITTSALQLGENKLVLSIVRDITERKAIEAQLRRQERLAAVGQLAAGIAHDFRNLLTTIILYAQLGLRKSHLPPGLAEQLKVIVGESRKATELVQQILDFGSCAEIKRIPVDLASLTTEVLSVLKRTIPENIHIILEVGTGQFTVEADAGRIQQVLTNLALNARDAMPEGGTLSIGLERVTLSQVSHALPEAMQDLANLNPELLHRVWICMTVADTGTGLSEEARAHLFEPFFTTKPEGHGTGLGLAQVYGIISLHDGYIDVQTAWGQGSTFYIYLPAVSKQTPDTETRATKIPIGHREVILLVEDDAQLREAGQNILTALGYQVLTAANGREGMAVYETSRAQPTQSIALVITDLVMPEMGGVALVRALWDRAPGLKALAVTGYTAEEDTETLKKVGFVDVIRKPFDADTLARAVQCALADR